MRREARQLDERRAADGLEERRREGLLAAGHGGEQDHGRALAHGRVEALHRAHVLAVDVDVHERRDAVAALEHLPAQAGEALGEVGEHVAQRSAVRLDLARAADLRAEGGWDADAGHDVTWVVPPWQNST